MAELIPIALTTEHAARIARLIEAGEFDTTGEIVREGLRLFFDAQDRRTAMKAKFNAEIDKGLASIERGELYDGEAVFEEMRLMLEDGHAPGKEQPHAAE